MNYNAKDIKLILKQKLKMIFLFICLLVLCSCKKDYCPTYQSYLSAGIGANCALCGLFRVLTTISSSAATAAWSGLASSLVPVVTIASALYIAVYTFKMLGSFGKQTVADYLTGDKQGLFLLMFKTAIIVLLLETGWIVSGIIIPLMQAGMEIGTVLSVAPGSFSYNTGAAGFSALFQMVYNAAKAFNDSAYEIPALGNAMICNGVLAAKELFHFWEWDWMMIAYGFVLVAFGWFFLIGISIYLVDVIVKLAFAAILLPIGVACAISNVSIGYTKNIWNLFLNVFFSFIMLGIIFGIIGKIVDFGLGGGGSNAGISTFTGAFSSTNLDKDAIKEISQQMLSGGALVLLIVSLCIMVNLTQEMAKLAGDISDTAGFAKFAPGSQAAAPFAKGATDAGKKAIGGVGGAIATGAKDIGGASARKLKLDKLYSLAGDKLEAIRGITTGSGRQGYRAWWHMMNWR